MSSTDPCNTTTPRKGINCSEFIFTRSAGSSIQGIQFKFGKGNGCNGEVDGGWSLVDGVATPQGFGGSGSATKNIPFTSSNKITFYICDNSGAQMTICGGCKISALLPPLPIELIAFSGTQVGKDNLLFWATASEQNSKHFEVEYSTSGTNFKTIGKVESAGESNEEKKYSYAHSDNSANTAYYRLKSVDKDGTFAYSHIIALVKDGKSAAARVFPNPTTNTVNIDASDREQMTRLYDLQGSLIYENIKTPEEIEMADFPSGVYFLQIAADIVKLVKE